MTTRDHGEVQVGGELTEQRLRAIMRRGWLFRNLCVSEAEALEYKDPHDPPPGAPTPPWSEFGGDQHTDGETPTMVFYEGDGGETTHAYAEVHVGCGEICPVFATIPYDGDMGGVPTANAEAIMHAGRDLIDLVREVVRLRASNEALVKTRPT